MRAQMYETTYYVSLGVWAALTVLCFAFYVREYVVASRGLRAMTSDLKSGESPGVKLYDALASREVAFTAMCVLLTYIGLIVLAFLIVPPHTADLTARALIARLLLLSSVGFLLRGYVRWQKFRDDERRQSVYAQRMDELKRSLEV